MKEKNETFESAFKKLEESVDTLEEGSIPLEEALKTFESGVQWSQECKNFLKKAEKRIEKVLKDEKNEYDQEEFVLD